MDLLHTHTHYYLGQDLFINTFDLQMTLLLNIFV